MRDKFNMSYKRVNARSKLYVNMTTYSARCLFSAKFVENISENHLLINIDEWCMGRSSKINYSRIKR